MSELPVTPFYTAICVGFSQLTFTVTEFLREVFLELESLESQLGAADRPGNFHLANAAARSLERCSHHLTQVVAFRKNLSEMVQLVVSYLRRRNSPAATVFRNGLGQLIQPITGLSQLAFQVADLVEDLTDVQSEYPNIQIPSEVFHPLFNTLLSVVRQVLQLSDTVIRLNLPVLTVADVQLRLPREQQDDQDDQLLPFPMDEADLS